MPSAKLTSKGQITIPAEVRDALGVAAGDRVDFVRMEDGRFALYAATRSVEALKGAIPLRRKPASLQEMQEAIATGAAKGIAARPARKK